MSEEEATAKYEAASEALREHELKHMKIQREYNASYAKLELLNRASADAWRGMMAEVEARVARHARMK